MYGASFHLSGDHHSVIRFRTRAAASWALFFHALGLDWQYEPEVFKVPGAGGLNHLPDFRVTSPQGVVAWYHVRPPGAVLDPVGELFAQWVAESDSRAVVRQLNGDPMDVLVHQSAWPCPRCGGIGTAHARHYGRLDIVDCGACGASLPNDDGALPEPGILAMQVHPFRGGMLLDVAKMQAFLVRVKAEAVNAARTRRLDLDAPRARDVSDLT